MDGTKRTKRKRAVKAEVKMSAPKAPPRPTMVGLHCLLGGAKIKDNGPITGQEYTFYPGEATPVDSRDVNGLLARRTSPKRCCGGRSRQPQPMYGIA